ncbi:hypothetical protein [Streptomyces gobiensis]|uniref:hypothetical protein n=1 Tax=Streptomyces gobiensis TaxID=2875706 RepID=UPI001E3CF487|nr:hypothetical protein [Streptomyces gobiensis]UGY90776.1 hypothetical protein test1122_02895 [Streptomyces gobiensis]
MRGEQREAERERAQARARAQESDRELEGWDGDTAARAEMLAEAGDWWKQAGELETAAERYRAAAEIDEAEGEGEWGSCWAWLAEVLFLLDREDEAQAALARAEAAAHWDTDGFQYQVLGEVMAELGRDEQAHAYFTAALMTAVPNQNNIALEDFTGPTTLARDALLSRSAVRGRLGWPPDSLDRMARDLEAEPSGPPMS